MNKSYLLLLSVMSLFLKSAEFSDALTTLSRMRLNAFPATPETDILKRTYQKLINDDETKELLDCIYKAESLNLLAQDTYYLTKLQVKLGEKNPAKSDELFYFFNGIIDRIKYKERIKQIQESHNLALDIKESHKKVLEQQNALLTIKIKVLENDNLRLGTLAATFIRKFLEVPHYNTPIEQENIIKERTCAICLTPFHDATSPCLIPHETHTLIKKIKVLGACGHIFCDTCYKHWKPHPVSPHPCPLCRSEGELFTFMLKAT